MKKEEIETILLDWNFWVKEQDVGIRRVEYLKRLEKLVSTGFIVDVIGVRRSGKSTILKQFVDYLIREKNIDSRDTLIVNFEDLRFTEFSLQLLQQILEVYLERIKKTKEKPYIFLDEVHKVKEWEKFVRSLHEKKEAFLVVSGSTSQLSTKELSTLLTGRHLSLFVFPLDFKSFLNFKGLEIKDRLELLAKRIEIKKLLREYLEFGGFPEVVLKTEKVKILQNYYEDILTRDIVNKFKIKEVEKLRTLAKFYVTNISNLITFGKIKNFLGMPLRTIERFSYYLESSFLIFFIKVFSKSIKMQEKAPRKVYCIDTGISNVMGLRFSENIGRLIENVVFLELLRKHVENPLIEIFYWKDYTGREVDFVVKENMNVKKLIQVTYASNKREIEKREIDALIRASNELKCKNLLLITWDYEDEIKTNNKTIACLPLWKWLLEWV
ncbi:MAG: ATP-binding protein [Candidatus Aenigmatarchaeota archaeon]